MRAHSHIHIFTEICDDDEDDLDIWVFLRAK